MFQVLPRVTRRMGAWCPLLPTPATKWVGSASEREELKESSPQYVMGSSLSKAAGLGMAQGSSAKDRSPSRPSAEGGRSGANENQAQTRVQGKARVNVCVR